MPDIPESEPSFQFGDMELYVQLETVLSDVVTCSVHLYTSKTPIGVSISDSLRAGVFFTTHLILNTEAEIDISSQFHTKLEDGVAFDIALFGESAGKSPFL
ncbi:hypothetical protein AB5N19_09875 [Seiridium cardinale]|uniref:Uncharacterized protein n=1 Tax=Seiridium cardinale TaxID=138064 RepID=A0ABR2Y9M7_9PEZI